MPVYHIPQDDLVFPHPRFAEPDGLLGIGGDLSIDRLILAYQNGIFPWYAHGEPIMWWCLHPRLILQPSALKISKSMQQLIRQSSWRVSIDTNFATVMQQCAMSKRKSQHSTWINKDLITSFNQLHHLHIAHSVEVWDDEQLIGGLYGLHIGNMFCGESMFTLVPNASKFGFIHFVKHLHNLHIDLIDCQQDTAHLRSFGASLWEQEDFFSYLEKNKLKEVIGHHWQNEKIN